MKINLEITVTEEIYIPDEWFEETNGEEPKDLEELEDLISMYVDEEMDLEGFAKDKLTQGSFERTWYIEDAGKFIKVFRE